MTGRRPPWWGAPLYTVPRVLQAAAVEGEVEGTFPQAVLRACTQMCRGGLFDHVGGGIHRYCVDEGWLVPHFEKMLYDNAMFARLLAEVAGDSPHPLLRAALRDTLDFMARDLADDETGCLVSSLDADSADEHGHSHEGLYYIWRAEEIDALLGDHATLFKQAYDVSRFGNWEGVNILNRLRHDTALSEEEEDILRLCRKKLRHARARRPAPAGAAREAGRARPARWRRRGRGRCRRRCPAPAAPPAAG
jgi:uncharacterized protein YyaL (SSP411 family)